MLKLLLSIPRDVVACHIVPFLDLVSLTKLDSATLSHVDRPGILIHVFTDVASSRDEVCTYSHDLISWLMCRQVHISGLRFPISTIDEDLVIAAPAMANLKHLDLTDCLNLTYEGVLLMLPACFSLNTICFTGFTWLVDDTLLNLADNHPNLMKLHLELANLVTDAAIIYVVDRCKFLSDVQLYGCAQIGDASIQALCHCVDTLSYLSILDCPRITEQSVVALIETVGSSLKILNVDRNGWMTENVVIALTKHCPNLERLHINGRITSAIALDFICAHISTKLRNCSLRGCPTLMDAHIESIAVRSTNLTSLIIHNAEQLTNKALKSIGENLPMLKSVTCFSSVLLSYEGFAAVARGCRNIESLDMSYCSLFCDESLREIVQNCSKLSDLRMNGTCVSSIGLGYVAEYCVDLTTIHLCGADAKEEDVMHMITSCTKLNHISYEGDASKQFLVSAKQRNIFLDVLPSLIKDSDSEEDGEGEEEEGFF